MKTTLDCIHGYSENTPCPTCLAEEVTRLKAEVTKVEAQVSLVGRVLEIEMARAAADQTPEQRAAALAAAEEKRARRAAKRGAR